MSVLDDRNLDTKKLGALLRDEEAVLAKALAKPPADLMVLNFKGYWHKNRAILYDISKRNDKKNGGLFMPSKRLRLLSRLRQKIQAR